MAADPDRDGETERTRPVRAINVTLAALGGVIPLVIAIAQLVEYIQSGKLNYIVLSVTLVLMVMVGITVLFTMDKRRDPRVVAISMLAILTAGIFFVIVLGLPPSGTTSTPTSASPSPSVSPEVSATSTTRPPRGMFTNPFNGQHVSGQYLSAAGNVEGISSTSALRCILKNDSGIYFFYTPQSAYGQWSATRVGLGPSDIDRPFAFTLILATVTQEP